MNFLQHPTALLSAAIIEEIRKLAPQAEQQKKLTQEQLSLIYQEEWLRLFIPKRYQGLEMSLPEALQILEALAYADGSLGWTVNLAAGANLFAAYIQPTLSERIYTDPKACTAGSGALSGIATQVKGGYEVKGSWKYGSASRHATAFTANFKLKTDSTNDTPDFYSFVFFPEEVRIKDTWDSYGLQATSSHDFEIDHVHVPEERIFSLLKPSPYEQGPLYRFPFMQFAEVTTCLQLTGMACHFFDEVSALLTHKKGMQGETLRDNGKVKDTLAQAEAQLESSRNWLYSLVHEAWQACENNKTIPEELLRKISLSAKHAAQAARSAAEMIYPLAGMSVLNPETDLNRSWRDLHTASQHVLLSPLGFGEVGKF
ncbi:acyl-CoA dehydrogenase family protein [Catalinimonas sp. 4WD22]|uniref:acyl-CoA dehydrogenase family protein n=1 Tax=Catalinimonas locisalis TaxID=3133978 RepID=UPI0031011820